MKIPGPDHPITIAPASGHVTVRYQGEVIAETDKALELREADYPAVLYIPRGDATLAHYLRTAHQTLCPYKGDASYFSLSANGQAAENAVWTYESPFPAVSAIKDHLAFYLDKVTIERS